MIELFIRSAEGVENGVRTNSTVLDVGDVEVVVFTNFEPCLQLSFHDLKDGFFIIPFAQKIIQNT